MTDTAEMAMLHDLRKEIDALIQTVGNTKKIPEYLPSGRELSLSYTHLQEAKMWLGQALGMLGSELPQQYADKAK